MSNTNAVRHANNNLKQQAKSIFTKKDKLLSKQKEHHDVRQDKRALTRARIASSQSARNDIVMLAHGLYNNPARIKKGNEQKRQTVKVDLWVKPIVKEHLLRLAENQGMTLSAAGASLLERSLQTNTDMKYSSIFDPTSAPALKKQRLINVL